MIIWLALMGSCGCHVLYPFDVVDLAADGGALTDAQPDAPVDHALTDRVADHTPTDYGATDGPPDAAAADLDPVAGCGRPSVIQDNFDDGVPASQWQIVQAAGSTATETGGELVVKPAAGSASYRSVHAVNLADDRLRVEVTAMLSTATTASASLAGQHDGQNEVLFVQQGGVLYARMIDAGTLSEKSVSYNPTAHRFWQIRESAGTVSWETSPDGTSWTSTMTRPTPQFARSLYIVLGAAAPPGASAGTARFDNLNLGRPPTAWCKTSSYSDSFNGVKAPEWRLIQSGACTVAETSNASFYLKTGGTSSCAFQTTAAYDLTGSCVMVNISALTYFFAPVGAFLAVEDDAQHRLMLRFEGSTPPKLRAVARTGVTKHLDTTSNYATTQDWWRIRESVGTVFWETASDKAGPWTVLAQLPKPFPVTALHAEFGVSTTAAIPNQVGIGFSSYNK